MITIDRDAETVTATNGMPIDPERVHSIYVTCEDGYGDHDVIVIPGYEGFGGEPVLVLPAVPLGRDGRVDLEEIAERCGAAGYVPMIVRMAGSFASGDIWTGTDFGYVATALGEETELVATLAHINEEYDGRSWDTLEISTVHGEQVDSVRVESSEDEIDYRAALERVGYRVLGTTPGGSNGLDYWVVAP